MQYWERLVKPPLNHRFARHQSIAASEETLADGLTDFETVHQEMNVAGQLSTLSGDQSSIQVLMLKSRHSNLPRERQLGRLEAGQDWDASCSNSVIDAPVYCKFSTRAKAEPVRKSCDSS